jgi:hypothetical protein
MRQHLLDLARQLGVVDGDGITHWCVFPTPSIDSLRGLFAQLRPEARRDGRRRSVRLIDEQDWGKLKRHFQPTPVGRHLQICCTLDTGALIE